MSLQNCWLHGAANWHLWDGFGEVGAFVDHGGDAALFRHLKQLRQRRFPRVERERCVLRCELFTKAAREASEQSVVRRAVGGPVQMATCS
jgi:hypothetical protein